MQFVICALEGKQVGAQWSFNSNTPEDSMVLKYCNTFLSVMQIMFYVNDLFQNALSTILRIVPL